MPLVPNICSQYLVNVEQDSIAQPRADGRRSQQRIQFGELLGELPQFYAKDRAVILQITTVVDKRFKRIGDDEERAPTSGEAVISAQGAVTRGDRKAPGSRTRCAG